MVDIYDKCRCECKKHHICKKDYVWNPAICNFENGKYLASIMDDSAIVGDEIIESYQEETNFNSNKKKTATCKTQNFYILLAFLLIFDDIINIKNFDPNNIKIDEKSYKNIHIYYVGYVTIKDSKYITINSVNPLYLIFNKVNGCFGEINKGEYLTLVPTNESKEKSFKI